VNASDIQARGAAASATDALNHLHADSREFVLHLDLDVIAQEEFPPVVVPGSGGLSFEDVRAALKRSCGTRISWGWTSRNTNPDKDTNGDAARKLVDLLVESLSARLETRRHPAMSLLRSRKNLRRDYRLAISLTKSEFLSASRRRSGRSAQMIAPRFPDFQSNRVRQIIVHISGASPAEFSLPGGPFDFLEKELESGDLIRICLPCGVRRFSCGPQIKLSATMPQA